MTQKVRWLAALALLLVFGACAVRAEDEDDEVRPAAPSRPIAELLPAPRPVLTPPASTVPQRPLLFAVPTPFPCPMPVPTGVFGLCPDCPACAVCPCPSGMCVCPAGARPSPAEEPSQYVVNMKLVKGADEETAEVTACPRVMVTEGQTATVLLHGVETTTEQSSLEMHATVTKNGKGARLEIGLAETGSHDFGESRARSHTETTEERCNVTFGKPYKMQLKNDAADRWLEVTVTEVEREERMPRSACVDRPCAACPVSQARAEEDACPMDAVGEIVDCLYDIVSDAATGAFAWALESNDDEEMAAPVYLQQPPQYVPPSPPLPVARVVSVEAAPACPQCTTASCPKAKSDCVQCAATDANKKSTLYIHMGAGQRRPTLERGEGDNHWTASADKVTVHGGCLMLEGNIHIEVGDGVVECTATTINVKLEDLVIQIGD